MELHGLDTKEMVCFYEQDFYVLSNFSSFKVFYKDILFDTSEQAYHYQKFNYIYPIYLEHILDGIMHCMSAHDCFKLANKYKEYRRSDWDEVKVSIMEEILRAKVAQHPYVKKKLLDTGDRLLVENSWRDDVWGWGPNKDGQNLLGKTWMKIREDIRKE